MKILPPSAKCGKRRGSATLVVLALLSIMAIYVTAEFTAATRLQTNLRRIERRQLERLRASPSEPGETTNSSSVHGQSSAH